MKRFDEAVASYDCAIELKPNDANALNNRGNALHKLRRFDEAVASYNQAISPSARRCKCVLQSRGCAA